MLATDFHSLYSKEYELIMTDRTKLDITDLQAINNYLKELYPDIVINFAAYTAVDDAEDVWSKLNMDVNALWVYNLAKATNIFGIDFITISSDYVFNWEWKKGYNESDIPNPLNAYWMAKYIWEVLSLQENRNTIIIRTSWLYWGWKDFKNFVNTMINLWNKFDSLKIINDQIWNPTYCLDLCNAIGEVLIDIRKYRWKKMHLSNNTANNGVSWFDFANEIFKQKKIEIKSIACTSEEFPTKAKRPHYSKLLNNSEIQLRDWEKWLKEYLSKI